MSKKMLIVFVLVCLCSSVAMALAPMGPPAAELKAGQWGAGADYSYTELDIKVDNVEGTAFFSSGVTAHDAAVNVLMARLGYGVCDNLEVFAALGGGAVEGDFRDGSDKLSYNGDWGLAFGIGSKVTAYEEGPIKLGALGQIGWFDWDGSLKGHDATTSGKADIDLNVVVIQIAPGITCKLTDCISIYGGPFWRWIDGDVDGKIKSGNFFGSVGSKGDADVEQDAIFGGWYGIQFNICENTSLNVEYQGTGSSNGLGVNVMWKI